MSTFFVFSDYLRPAVCLAALSSIPAIYVLTHDSIAVGEDGPTHEPVEHLSSYRGMPNVTMMRPADANETAAVWKVAMESEDRPTLLALTRQNVPVLPNTKELAMAAQKELREKGHDVSVVSMPSLELFELQSDEYKQSVLPKEVTKRVAVEMGSPFGWDRYVGFEGKTGLAQVVRVKQLRRV